MNCIRHGVIRACRAGLLTTLIWAGVTYPGVDTARCEAGPGEPKTLEECFSIVPGELTLREDEPQAYVLTTQWHNRDLYGNLTDEYIITGGYTRALEDGLVRWKNVYIIFPHDSEETPADSVFQESVEGWSYKSPEDIASAGFFDRLPSDESQHLLRTLIWDAVVFETFAWTYFDKLELNETVEASEFEDFTAQMADWGKLVMKDLRLTWTGITKLNGEACAVIDYRSWANPVDSSSILMSVKGRSLYWGEIWISLEDKQIERATMNEDVIMEMISGHAAPKYQNMQREVTFEKITQSGEEE